MNGTSSLRMSFDPHTIEHLGVKMYSNIPNALAELVANSYDAEASVVNILLLDQSGNKSITIEDDGVGMDFNEINEKFLRIGRKRRLEEETAISPNGLRKVTGKKGLGKLAFFGLGDTIEVSTWKNGEKVSFTLDWNELMSTTRNDYEPKFTRVSYDKSLHGTSITLSNLKRKSAFDGESLAVSLSKLFNVFDANFKVYISINNGEAILIDEKLRYKDLHPQFIWQFPDFLNNFGSYGYRSNISGQIFSTEKPLKPGLRGITLFANGRLANAAEFFGVSESSHGYSYFTGWLNVDFVDDWTEDVISTDRQSLNWDYPQTAELREYLKSLMYELERDWRRKRNEERKKHIKERTHVDVASWYTKLPGNVLAPIETIVTAVTADSELPLEKQADIVQMLHSLIPEFPYYHWRHLHSTVQDASREDYNKKDYYRAFDETVKRYISNCRIKSSSTNTTDSGMMGEIFGRGKTLQVASKYKKPDGTNFTVSTIDNVEEGQKFLSMGILAGARNPIAHEEIAALRDSGLFSENDCLDALSLLSHLFRRLDNA